MKIGAYEVVRKLGEGSMGKVYLVNKAGSRDYYALKVLTQGRGYETRYHRFQREIRSLSMLDHPNIVRVYDSGTMNNIPYYVMEYIEGETLSSLLNRKKILPIPVQNSIDFVQQIAKALAYLHEKKIIHRDLKPSNIMLDVQNHFKITDFGLVKFVGSDESMMTETGTIVGTIKYMSPEQALGKKIDIRTDIYSLGVIFYIFLTGRFPFDDEEPISLLWRIIQDEPPEPTAINPDVPESLSRIIMKMMAKKPRNRFSSAEALITILQQMTRNYSAESGESDDSFLYLTSSEDNTPLNDDEDQTETVDFYFDINYHERSHELHEILKLVHECEHNLLMISVQGEEGVGKSKLMKAVKERLNSQSYNVVTARSLVGYEQPYQLVTNLFQNVLRYFQSDSYRYARESAHIVDSNEDSIINKSSSGVINPSPLSLFQDDNEHVWEMRKRRFRYWSTLYTALMSFSKDKPLVLILEDAHNCDQEEWLFLRFLKLSLEGERDAGLLKPRITIFVTIKDEAFLESSNAVNFIQEMKNEGLLEQLILESFDEAKTEHYIKAMLGASALPPEFFGSVHAITQGNPLFLELIIQDLIRRQVLIRDIDGKCITEQNNNAAGIDFIPGQFSDVIMGQYTRLPEKTRKVLEIAAVIGQQFDFTILESLAGISQKKLYDALNLLMHNNLIVKETLHNATYSFKHPLMQELIYSLIDVDERKILHRHIAKLYRSEVIGDMEVTESIIAYHYREGDSHKDASRFYFLAAQKAFLNRASEKAILYFNHAIESLNRISLSGENEDYLQQQSFLRVLYENSGYYNLAFGNYSTARSLFQKLYELAEKSDNVEWKIRALIAQSESLLFDEKTVQAQQVIEVMKEILSSDEECISKDILKKAKELEAFIAFRNRNYSESLRCFNEVMHLQVFLPPNLLTYIRHLVSIADAHMVLENHNEAYKYYNKAHSIATDKMSINCMFEPLRGLQAVSVFLDMNEESELYRQEAETLAYEQQDLGELLMTYLASFKLYQKVSWFSNQEQARQKAMKLARKLNEKKIVQQLAKN